MLVDVDASPGCSLQEGGVVLSSEEDLGKKCDFFAELADGGGERSVFWLDMTTLHGTDVVLDDAWVLVVLEVSFDIVGRAKSVQLFVQDIAYNVLQQIDDILLLFQEILIS